MDKSLIEPIIIIISTYTSVIVFCLITGIFLKDQRKWWWKIAPLTMAGLMIVTPLSLHLSLLIKDLLSEWLLK